VKGIRAGKFEYRERSIWGNPYLRILRGQLEQYIAGELGTEHLLSGKDQAELRKIKKEMAGLKKRLCELEERKTEMEKRTKKMDRARHSNRRRGSG
jgi:hypothetical protein